MALAGLILGYLHLVFLVAAMAIIFMFLGGLAWFGLHWHG